MITNEGRDKVKPKEEIKAIRSLVNEAARRIDDLEATLGEDTPELPFQEELDDLVKNSSFCHVAEARPGKVRVQRLDGRSITIERGFIKFRPGEAQGVVEIVRGTLRRIARLYDAMKGDC